MLHIPQPGLALTHVPKFFSRRHSDARSRKRRAAALQRCKSPFNESLRIS